MRFGVFIILFLAIFSTQLLKAQTQTSNSSACDLVFKKAAVKYQMVFNYDAKILQNIECINQFPKDFIDFRILVEEYTGLTFEKFNGNSWIIKKNFTHQINILDEKNNPIEGAIVSGSDTQSNLYGKLFLNLATFPKNYSLTYQNKEAASFSIFKDSPKILNVYAYTFVNLQEVTISGLYTNGIFLNGQNHLKVSTKKVALLAGQTQQDAFVSLLNLPQINSPVESIAELNIKGGINDQNLVLWNGIRMFQNSHFFGLLSAYNENLIHTLSIIDNATPVQYSNALSGTMVLSYDDQFTKKNSVGAGINTLSGQVFSRLKIDENTEFSIAFQRSFTDVFNSPTFQSYSQKAYRDTDLELTENADVPIGSISRKDHFVFKDAQFQVKRKFSDDLQVNLQGIWFVNQLNYQETINNLDTKLSDYNKENVAVGIDAHYQISNKQRVVFQTNFSQHNSQGQNNTFSGNQDTKQINQVENYFTQAYWQQDLKKGNIELGADFQGSILTNRFNNLITAASLNLVQISNVYSAFGARTYTTNKWKLYAGLKNMFYERDRLVSIEPRLSVSYKLDKNVELTLRGEEKSQNFKQIIDLDQNFLGIEKRRWVVSGDSISPPLQRTRQLEAFLKWNFNRIGGYSSIYARKLEGISTNDQRFQNQGQFENLSEADSTIYGFLFHLYYKNDWFNSWISYAHLNEQINLDNQQFNGINNIDHQVTLGNNFKWNQWSLSLALQYHSGLPYTEINANNPLLQQTQGNINRINFEKPNEARLPDYLRLDSSIQYSLESIKAGSFKFSLGLINLTNEHNILRRNFRLNRIDENIIQQIENVGLNFTVNFGILWSL